MTRLNIILVAVSVIALLVLLAVIGAVHRSSSPSSSQACATFNTWMHEGQTNTALLNRAIAAASQQYGSNSQLFVDLQAITPGGLVERAKLRVEGLLSAGNGCRWWQIFRLVQPDPGKTVATAREVAIGRFMASLYLGTA